MLSCVSQSIRGRAFQYLLFLYDDNIFFKYPRPGGNFNFFLPFFFFPFLVYSQITLREQFHPALFFFFWMARQLLKNILLFASYDALLGLGIMVTCPSNQMFTPRNCP